MKGPLHLGNLEGRRPKARARILCLSERSSFPQRKRAAEAHRRLARRTAHPGSPGRAHRGNEEDVGCGLAALGDARARPAGSCAHLAGRVILTRSLRRQRRVLHCFVHRGEGRDSEGGRRRALHDPISLLRVASPLLNQARSKGGQTTPHGAHCPLFPI